MARVDSILTIMAQQGANELRLGTDREPKILSYGVAKKLSIPSTPEDTLRELLGEILDGERDEVLRSRGRLDVWYEAGGLGSFQSRRALGSAPFPRSRRRWARPLRPRSVRRRRLRGSSPTPPRCGRATCISCRANLRSRE
jgi:hypothetical protein